MGLSTAYIRKLARNKEGTNIECSYIRAGGGFTDDHWHDEIDVEHIIQTRIASIDGMSLCYVHVHLFSYKHY